MDADVISVAGNKPQRDSSYCDSDRVLLFMAGTFLRPPSLERMKRFVRVRGYRRQSLVFCFAFPLSYGHNSFRYLLQIALAHE